ncbi:MAG: monovalent cation:proton antiporter-2 (CPA2) family protein [Xanthomonadales bacterium]|nr:monovalent cation:proton antiporter-2 (CPA2) family protein [Xanthomonadales bacterium]
MLHELGNILILLAAAVIAVPIAKKLRLGAVLGYLVAGLVIGPFALGLIRTPEEVLELSELGVVMLLFVIGLELSPQRLWLLRRSVFGVGALQVGSALLPLALIGWWLGLGMVAAAVAAFGLALSSTAFVLQILAERNELTAEHGRSAFGVLLFQDLIAVPVLALLPLAGSSADSGLDWAKVGQVLGAIAIVMFAGRFLSRPLFRLVARARSTEVFTAASLLVVLGTAALMHAVGLSMALGAFLAGVLLANSEYRHELEAHVEPFKGLLLGLFFLAVGMNIDLRLLSERPLAVLALMLGFLLLKFAVLGLLAWRLKLPRNGAPMFVALLAPGGEFAFVVYQQAQANGVLPVAIADLLTLAVALSMAATPLLVLLVEAWIARRQAEATPRPDDVIDDERPQVVIVGFGRVGQIIGRILKAKEICFVAIDPDTNQVDLSRRFGNKIYYGDPSRAELLRAAGAEQARMFILAVDDPAASVRIAGTVRRNFPDLPILARARNRQHAFALMDLGITRVIRETLHSSLWMSRQLLEALGLDAAEALQHTERFRVHDEQLLSQQQLVHGDEAKLMQTTMEAREELARLFEADRRSEPTGS